MTKANGEIKMMNTNFQKVLKLGATALIAILSCASARAQAVTLPDLSDYVATGQFPDNRWSFSTSTPAGGINGANRRVVVSDYQAASGSFPEPTFWINPETVGELGGVPDQQTNKPSFYLGGWTQGGLVFIDAGMQWEPEPNIAKRVDAGWSLFINVAMTTVLPDTNNTRGNLRFSGNPVPAWRADQGQLGTTQLGFTLDTDGRAIITATTNKDGVVTNKSVGPVPVLWPKKNDGSINLSNMEVRRVVALTQAYGSDQLPGLTRTPDGQWVMKETTKVNFDGSWVHGLTNTGASVTQFTSDTNGKLTQGTTDNWPSSDATSAILPYIKNIDGPWIIEFPHSKRGNDPLGKYVPNYGTETVDIEVMKKPATLTAKKTTSGKSYPFN